MLSFAWLHVSALLAGSMLQLGLPLPVAEICYSPERPFAQAAPPDNDTVFACPQAGNLSVIELAQRGYRIVRITPVTGPTSTTIRQQLLLRREMRIHANGFES